MRQTGRRVLFMLAPNRCRAAPGFLRGERGENTGHEQPVIIVTQVDVSGHRGHVANPGLLAEVDELLQLDGEPVQPVQVLHDQPVPRSGFQVGDHPGVGRYRSAGVGGDVVVHVLLTDDPPPVGREGAAVLQLALHTQPLTTPISGNPGDTLPLSAPAPSSLSWG